MAEPRVLNRKALTKEPPGAVYVGRPSKWGNPYVIGRDGDRKEVIRKYKRYLRRTPRLMKAMDDELREHDFICWCAPLACHADVLLRLANAKGE